MKEVISLDLRPHVLRLSPSEWISIFRAYDQGGEEALYLSLWHQSEESLCDAQGPSEDDISSEGRFVLPLASLREFIALLETAARGNVGGVAP
jgi:hypothetical protein